MSVEKDLNNNIWSSQQGSKDVSRRVSVISFGGNASNPEGRNLTVLGQESDDQNLLPKVVEYDSQKENPFSQLSQSPERPTAPVAAAPVLNVEKLATLTNTPIMTLRLDTLDKSKTFEKTNRPFKHAEIIKSK